VRAVTVATDLDSTLLTGMLVPSCAAVGLTLDLLRPEGESFQLADKRPILADYLSRLPDPNELVVFTDAYDTLFLRGPSFIERAYSRFSQPVVFSAERTSWPLGVEGFALYDRAPRYPYPYLNSGGFIGPAGDLLDLCVKYPEPPSDRFAMLEQLRAHGYDTDERYGFSDQYHWTLVYLLERDLIGLDHEGILFQCYAPRIPVVSFKEILRDAEVFRAEGRTWHRYRKERGRLQAELREPSKAAHLHFAGHVTKAVVLDLLEEGLLPAWITAACDPSRGEIR
jgi:hypothetical protein